MPKETEKIFIFKEHGLWITIEANKQVVNFLDIIFNLTNNAYSPYSKPNSTLLYIHELNIHPSSIIQNIPEGINRWLSSISSNKKSFDLTAPPYQKALCESG